MLSDPGAGNPSHFPTGPAAMRFEQYVAVNGIAVTPADKFEGYAMTVVLPPDWALFDPEKLGELPGKRVWGWPADPFIERFGANAVLSLSRIGAAPDPAELFAMLCESQIHLIEGTQERARSLTAATEGPGIVGLQFLEMLTEEFGRIGSASRTRIAPAGSQTLIAQLTVTALVDSPVDFADMGLTMAPVDTAEAAGPAAPIGYHSTPPAATTPKGH